MVHGLLGADEPDGSRARLIGVLVDFLCVQDFVTDRDQCAQFIGFAAEQLGAEITYARKNPRADMLSFVRDLLKYEKGLGALTFTVGVIAGPECAAQLTRLSGAARSDGTVAGGSPDFSDGAVREIHRLLADVRRVDDGRLHALLNHELGVDIPYGQTPAQRFDHLCGVNTQADGLPPAFVLVEITAFLERPALREGLREWSDAWAREVGPEAVQALEERRRAIAALPASDPDVARCLVVMVEPADDSSADIYVRHWVNAAPGFWEPVAGDVRPTTVDGLAAEVERAIGRGQERWAGMPVTENEPTPQVEFVLPFSLLNHDMARLEMGTWSGDPLPISLHYHVHLRSLERMRAAQKDGYLPLWRERWTQLRNAGVAESYRWHGEEGERLDRWRAKLIANPGLTAVILDVPALPGLGLEALVTAIAQGVGLAAWDRRTDSPELSGEVLTLLLAHPPSQIPSKVSALRKKAEGMNRDHWSLGKHLALMWDDPNRLIDCEELTA
ncbi:VMAP-C domain-containing protein [Streptomyces sp. NPDC002125]